MESDRGDSLLTKFTKHFSFGKSWLRLDRQKNGVQLHTAKSGDVDAAQPSVSGLVAADDDDGEDDDELARRFDFGSEFGSMRVWRRFQLNSVGVQSFERFLVGNFVTLSICAGCCVGFLRALKEVESRSRRAFDTKYFGTRQLRMQKTSAFQTLFLLSRLTTSCVKFSVFGLTFASVPVLLESYTGKFRWYYLAVGAGSAAFLYSFWRGPVAALVLSSLFASIVQLVFLVVCAIGWSVGTLRGSPLPANLDGAYQLLKTDYYDDLAKSTKRELHIRRIMLRQGLYPFQRKKAEEFLEQEMKEDEES